MPDLDTFHLIRTCILPIPAISLICLKVFKLVPQITMNASFINLKLRIQFRNTAVINLLYEQICNCVTFTYDGRKGLFFFVMLCYTHVCCAMCRCVDCNLLLSSEEEGRGCYPLGRTGDSDSLFFFCFFPEYISSASVADPSLLWSAPSFLFRQ